MDNDLLQKPEVAASRLPSNDEIEPSPDVPEDFRELRVEAAQPPLRLVLDPPVEYDGQKFDKLVFDFDSMIGKDFQRAERTFSKLYRAEKNEFVMPETKHLFHSIVAAQVADVPVGLILKLPRRYYVAVRTEALKACGSSPEEEKA